MKFQYEDGAKVRRDVQGPKSDLLQDGVKALDSDLADWVDGFVFGAVWGRDGLSQEDRTIVAISVLAASRNHDQLEAYLFGALHKGVSARKIQEVLVMLTVYSGFPVAIQALTVFRSVVTSVRSAGVDIDLDSIG